MSPQAIGSPDEIELFARNLNSFNRDLLGMVARLNGQFNSLGDTWRDQEQARFAEELQGALAYLQRFSAQCEQQTPFLLRKAARLRDYLGQR